MSISDHYSALAAALPYPTTGTREERAAGRKVYDAATRTVTQDFAAALADEYFADIAEPRRAALAERTFTLAWEHGHSSGYGEVESYYQDFASYALAVYAVATS